MQYGLIILFFVFNFFNCELTRSEASPRSIAVRLSSVPQTLDWNRATSGSEGAVIQNLMDGLFQYDDHFNPVPHLVNTYRWSSDGKTLELTLKKGILWSDGKPLTAQHCVDSFQRLLDPNFNSPNASILFVIKNARDFFYGKVKHFSEVGVHAKGTQEIILTLDEPRANFLHVLTYWATFPVRKDHPSLTLGSYQLVSQTPLAAPTTIKLLGKKPAIREIVFKVIPNGKDALKAYENKEIDYLLQVEDELSQVPHIEFTDPLRVVVLLHLNPSKINTNTPEKRRSIMDSITHLNLASSSSSNRVPAKSIIPPGILGSQESSPPAGLKRGSLPEAPLLLGYPQDQLSQSIAEEIQRNSKEIKIRVEPFTLQNAKRYDLILTIFGLDFMDPDQLLSSFLSQGTHDLFNFNSPELPALMNQARRNQNVASRSKLYAEAADYLQYKAAIVAPLFYRRRAFVLRPEFKRGPHATLGSPVIRHLH